jgi:hypothetical protein
MVLIQGRKDKESDLKSGRYTGEKVQFVSTVTVRRCAVVVVVVTIIIIIIKVDQNVLLGTYRNIYFSLSAPSTQVSSSPKSVGSQVMNCLGHLIRIISSKRSLHHSCSDLLYVHLLSVIQCELWGSVSEKLP